MNHRWNAKKGWKRCLRCGLEGFRGLPPLPWTLWTRETGLFSALTLPSCVESRFPSTRLEMLLARMEARALERMARYYGAPALLAGSGEDSATARAQKGTRRYTYTFWNAQTGREVFSGKPHAGPTPVLGPDRVYERAGKRWRRVR